MESIKDIYFTIDVDMADYVSSNSQNETGLNEWELTFSTLRQILANYPALKSTWYIRIDNQMAFLYGEADYIFKKHNEDIEWLMRNGHELGWHIHPYKYIKSVWVQNINEEEIIKEIANNAPIAQRYELKSIRMGWGYHTNKTMMAIDKLNFKIDSSAIPKPVYKWEKSKKDWSITPSYPYHPSIEDYRIGGPNHFNIIEFPMTTCNLGVHGDTELVKRYISPTYKTSYFRKACNKISGKYIQMIMHPYEILPNKAHPILAFAEEDLRKNIEFLIKEGVEFKTISKIIES